MCPPSGDIMASPWYAHGMIMVSLWHDCNLGISLFMIHHLYLACVFIITLQCIRWVVGWITVLLMFNTKQRLNEYRVKITKYMLCLLLRTNRNTQTERQTVNSSSILKHDKGSRTWKYTKLIIYVQTVLYKSNK